MRPKDFSKIVNDVDRAACPAAGPLRSGLLHARSAPPECEKRGPIAYGRLPLGSIMR